MKNVYDHKDFFEQYETMRGQEVNANNLIEIPIMKSILPKVKNKTILDLGCGTGDMDEFFIQNGAKHVVATDISKNMILKAQKKHPSKKIDFQILKMENLSKLEGKFDIVYSSLAFHYVKDFNKLIKNIYNLLKPNGILVFSQESPIALAPIFENETDTKKVYIGEKQYNLLSDYCNEGERNNYWNGIKVTKYHRTYITLIKTLLKNNFEIIDMLDSYASKRAIELCDKYKHPKDKPFFVFFKVKKKSVWNNFQTFFFVIQVSFVLVRTPF